MYSGAAGTSLAAMCVLGGVGGLGLWMTEHTGKWVSLSSEVEKWATDDVVSRVSVSVCGFLVEAVCGCGNKQASTKSKECDGMCY